MRFLGALIVAAALATPAHADDADARRARRYTIRLLALTGGIALHSTSEYLVKDQLVAESCRWCKPPGFDASVREALVWDDPAAAGRLSNATGYAGVPVLAGALFAISARQAPCWGRRFAEDALPIVEALVYTQLVTQLSKISVGRQRPAIRFATTPPEPTNEDNMSFYSGHSSIAFAIAVSASTIAHRRGYKLAPAISIGTLALAVTTAYLRIAADRHYLSDVLVGSAAGATGGYLIPKLTEGRGVGIAPTANGIAMFGTL